MKKLRELLLNKIEQNEFLYNLMTNPDYVYKVDKPFEFHGIEGRNDQTLEFDCDCQYIAVEGPYNGRLYVSNQFIMFKSKCEEVRVEQYKFALHVSFSFV